MKIINSINHSLTLGVIYVLILSGCIITHDNMHRGGTSKNKGNLSDALKGNAKPVTEANDFNNDNDGNSTDDNLSPTTHENIHTGGRAAGHGVYVSQGGNSDMNLQLGLIAYSITVNDDYVDNIHGVGPKLLVGSGRYATELYLGLEAYDFKAESDFSLGAKNDFGILLGVSQRVYLNDKHVFISPYVGGGLGFGTLTWEYKNAVMDIDGSNVERDSLNFLQGEMFAGLEVSRSKNMGVYGQIGGVMRGYSTETQHGFINDVLDANAGYKIMVGVTINY